MRDNRVREATAVMNRELPVNRGMVLFLGIASFALLTALGAWVRIPLPFTPVPITLQVFFVLLCAVSLGPVYGAFSQTAYLALGAAGLPMFTLMGAGFGHVAGPTGGYILGFIAAQPAVGLALGRDRSAAGPLRTAAALALGIAVIYLFGAVHLKLITGASAAHVLATGVLPFIPGDLLKAAAAAAIFSKTRRGFTEIF